MDDNLIIDALDEELEDEDFIDDGGSETENILPKSVST